jgi:hypothetical protein
VGFNECALVATQTLSGLTPTAKQSATLARASATHPILKSGSLPLPPHRVHRAERRSMLLDASASHRMIHGASAVETRCRQRSQITQSQGVTPRSSARVATDILAVPLIVEACRQDLVAMAAAVRDFQRLCPSSDSSTLQPHHS